MKVEETNGGGSQITTYAPAIVLVFEIEAADPVVSIPDDLNAVARIMAGVSDEWRELLERAVEDVDV